MERHPREAIIYMGSIWYLQNNITITHNITNPVISTILIILRVYDTLQINHLPILNYFKSENGKNQRF